MPRRPPVLARIAVLVPVRGLEGAKARLGEALDAEERRALVERLLERTVTAASAAGATLVAVVSPDPEALQRARQLGVAAVAQRGGGLNEGLEEGRAWAEAAGVDALLVVPADVPAVSPAALEAVMAAARDAAASRPMMTASPGMGAPGRGPAPAGQRGVAAPVARSRGLVVLVPDRGGTGTNVLLLAPPRAIAFRFGEGSRAAHAAAARDTGAIYVELGGPLALDLDTPDDLLAAEALGLADLRTGTP